MAMKKFPLFFFTAFFIGLLYQWAISGPIQMFQALGTGDSPTFAGLTLTQGALTADAQALSSTATWNAAGVTFTHLKTNVTDTASAAGSLLMDLQVGGVSKFNIQKDGTITAGTSVVAPLFTTVAGIAFSATATLPTAAASTAAGVNASLTASNATAGTTNAGAAAGGSVTITAGNAARLTSGNANGGNINLVPGLGIGTGSGGQVLLPDGSDSAPSLARASNTATGFVFNNTNHKSISVMTGGNEFIRLLDASQVSWGLLVAANSHLGWNNSVLPGQGGSASPDLLLFRDAAAQLQLGADTASPVTQTLKAHDGSGTDKAGAKLVLAGGNGTGTAAGGEACLATTLAGGGSGSTQNTSADRLCIPTDGGARWQTAAEPTCNASHRGVINYVAGGAGVLDTFKICRKDAADAYAWVAWGTAL